MSTEQPYNQRRQSCRLPVGEAVQARLRLADGSQWPVRLLDQSAGGFAVLADAATPAIQGDVVQLRTDSFCAEVRIIFSMEIEPADGGGTASAPRFRLGLMRLRDLAMPADENRQRRRWIPRRFSLAAASRTQIALLLGVFVVPVTLLLVFGILVSEDSLPRIFGYSSADMVYPGREAQTESTGLPGSLGSSGTMLHSGHLDMRPDDLKHLPAPCRLLRRR